MLIIGWPKAGWDKSILAIELQHLLNIETEFDITVTGFEIPEIDLLLFPGDGTPDSNRENQRSRGLLFMGLMLAAAALAAGWRDRELIRRAGVILGTDFFVVHAHARTVPHLTQSDSIKDHATLATFDDPEAGREEQQLSGEINVLEKEIAIARLKPLSSIPS